MQPHVPKSLYFPYTDASVMQTLQAGRMPEPFVRRMRFINVISAIVIDRFEEGLLEPFDLFDVNHILNKQISQDAIIDQLTHPEMIEAFISGNLEPLYDRIYNDPDFNFYLSVKMGSGFSSGWIDRFFNDPFHEWCILLALRIKLLLDCFDELGHSFNLIRGVLLPPLVPPGGDVPPPPPPGGSEPPPIYTGPGILGPPPVYPGGGGAGVPHCCKYFPPAATISIGFTTGAMEYGESQELTLEGIDPACPDSWFEWIAYAEGSTITATGKTVTYTAPAPGAACVTNELIVVFCAGLVVASGGVSLWRLPINPSIGYATQQMDLNEQQALTLQWDAPGCGTLYYEWAVVSGGGTIEDADNYSCLYTAPASNPNCTENPLIAVEINFHSIDNINLSINGYTGGARAGRHNYGCKHPCSAAMGQLMCAKNCVNNPAHFCWECATYYFMCDSSFQAWESYNWNADVYLLPNCQNGYNLYCSTAPSFNDMRTEAQKLAGCCPALMLL